MLASAARRSEERKAIFTVRRAGHRDDMMVKDDLSAKEKIQYNWVVDVFFKYNEYFYFLAPNDFSFKLKPLFPKRYKN